MKIAVVGCGAMGTIYAGLLATASNTVTAMDANHEHVRAINESGLRVSGASGDRTVSLRAFTSAPGHAHHNDMRAIRFDAHSTRSRANVERIAALWTEAGFDTEAVANIAVMQWEKLICNVAYSAPCALSGMTIGEAMNDDAIGPLSLAAAIEAWTIAKARGIALTVEDPVAHVRDFASRMPNAKPSVLLDIEACRMSEIDVINGAVAKEAELVGLSAPVNETLTRLVKSLERR